jgi:hypothetical protein
MKLWSQSSSHFPLSPQLKSAQNHVPAQLQHRSGPLASPWAGPSVHDAGGQARRARLRGFAPSAPRPPPAAAVAAAAAIEFRRVHHHSAPLATHLFHRPHRAPTYELRRRRRWGFDERPRPRHRWPQYDPHAGDAFFR